MEEVILSPEYQKQLEEIERLSASLSMIILERDELKEVICKNIETEYMMKVGDLEYRCFRAMCEYLRAKRKAELIQACVNRGEIPDMAAVEAQLETEFEAYRTQMEERLRKMNDAIERSRGKYLSEEENDELKKLYRQIVRLLHPDVNPNVTSEQLRLYQKAVEAYRNGDLGTMRFIHVLVMENRPDELTMTPNERIANLKSAIERVRAEIGTIKSSYPYSLSSFLKDKKAVAAKRSELEESLKNYKARTKDYASRTAAAAMN